MVDLFKFFGLHLKNVYVFFFCFKILLEVMRIFLSLAIYKLSYSNIGKFANNKSKCHFPKDNNNVLYLFLQENSAGDLVDFPFYGY